MSIKSTPKKFLRIALIISGVWFLLVYPAIHWFYPRILPRYMKMGEIDYAQYYIGAVAASHGMWEELYPTLNEEYYAAPPAFLAPHITLFFNPDDNTRIGKLNYYEQASRAPYSVISPKIVKFHPILAKHTFYFYPPPLVLLLWPLGLFDYETSSKIWFWILCASFFGIAWFSSRLCGLLYQQPPCESYVPGCVALLPLALSLLGSRFTSFYPGNSSPLLGFLIAWVVYSWCKNRQFFIGFGIVSLALFKGIGLSWIPLLFMKPIRWKVMATMGIITFFMVSVTIYLGGTELYHAFFKLLPMVDIPLGYSLSRWSLRYIGIDITPICSTLNILLLIGLFWGYWRQCGRASSEIRPAACMATFAGTMASFCIFNKVVWLHYYTNYVFLPFAGWLLWEAFQTTGRQRKLILVLFCAEFIFWFDGLLFIDQSFAMEWLQQAGYYNKTGEYVRHVFFDHFVGSVFVLGMPAGVLLLAYRRLFFAATPQTASLQDAAVVKSANA